MFYKIAFSFLLLSILALKVSSQNLKVAGKQIVNDKGENIILRGIGVGGWMLQEGYMLRVGNIGPQYKIKDSIEALIGKEKTQIFYDKWLSCHLRKIDIDSLATWGFNSVRLPLHYNLFSLPSDEEPVPGQNTWLKKGFELTDSLLSWCKSNKIYLILDMHATPGGQGNDNNISDRDTKKPSLWQSEANQQKFIALWSKLAERYANESWIGGYDLINEPNWGFENTADRNGLAETKNELLRSLMLNTTKAIREKDKKHIIIIEGNGWGNNYKGIFPLWDSNTVVSFHKYWNYNDQSSIQQFLDIRDKYNVPIWLGETGENSNVWFSQAIKLTEHNNIGWSWWPLKKIGNNNPLEIKFIFEYQQLVDYWNGKSIKPSANEAFIALMKLAEATKLENCIYHKDVVDAMFRQIRNNEAIPFKNYKIGYDKYLFAVDYDLGGNGVAYFDKDTADYHISTNQWTAGNTGHIYRNDGVDIEKCTDSITNGYNVCKIENGEWLQYTVMADIKSNCDITLRIANALANNTISLFINNIKIGDDIVIPNMLNEKKWTTISLKGVKIEKGINRLKVFSNTGGYKLNYMQISASR